MERDMRRVLWAAVILLSASGQAASAQLRRATPYKMILREGQSMTTIDYPSRARCDAAKAVIDGENAQKQEDARRRMEATRGNIIISPLLLRATCVPV